MSVRRAIATMVLLLAVSYPAAAEQERVYPALEEPAHKPVFHNDRIDVYDVQLKPGQRSFYHMHSRDQLGIVLRSGTSLNQPQGASETASRNERGAISYIPHSALGGYVHRVRAGNDPFRVIGIEFATPAPAGSKRLMAAPDQPVFQFPQGRVTRLAIAPGDARTMTGSLIIAMAPGELEAADSAKWAFDEGSVQWIGGRTDLTYRNRTSSPIQLLVLALAD